MTTAVAEAPEEPVLDVDQIQGIAAPGFFKPHQMLLGVRYARESADIVKLKRLLGELSGELATARVTLKDRREHRNATEKKRRPPKVFPPLVALGLSYQGLFDLTPGAAEIPSPAFRIGLVGRSALLGDGDGDGAPANWKVGKPTEELDLLIVVAGDDRESVAARARELETRFVAINAKVSRQPGDVRDDVKGEVGHEHFGFDDGVSQPGIRGRTSEAANDLLTERHVDPSQFPANALYGYPGQDLVWPGEFVIGYPATGPDPLIAGPPSVPIPVWTLNGSFLVYRRLLQNVGAFWRTMRDEAERLALLPGFEGLDDVTLASRLVGRWPSGAPVLRTPAKDDPPLGKDQLANNHFRFDSDTPALKLKHGRDDYPAAKPDPIGATCPLAAHIRKVNTRDAPSDTGARSSTYERRLLRVGVPFGPSALDRYAHPTPGDPERGLLFLSIQSSIEDQFEFLQSRWINDDARPKATSGNDMVVGQNAVADGGVRRCVVTGKGGEQAEVRAPAQFVTASGGGYFFIPSIGALKTVIAGASK
jgi:Dyp-type peroxidase family